MGLFLMVLTAAAAVAAVRRHLYHWGSESRRQFQMSDEGKAGIFGRIWVSHRHP